LGEIEVLTTGRRPYRRNIVEQFLSAFRDELPEGVIAAVLRIDIENYVADASDPDIITRSPRSAYFIGIGRGFFVSVGAFRRRFTILC